MNPLLPQHYLVAIFLGSSIFLVSLLGLGWMPLYFLPITLTVLLEVQLMFNSINFTKINIPKFILKRINLPTGLPAIHYLLFAVTLYISLFISFLLTFPLIMPFAMFLWSFEGDSHPPPIYAVILVMTCYQMIVLGVNFLVTQYALKFAWVSNIRLLRVAQMNT